MCGITIVLNVAVMLTMDQVSPTSYQNKYAISKQILLVKLPLTTAMTTATIILINNCCIFLNSR